MPAVNPHLLAYDFFKHMTNLSIITLGGMVTLFGSVFANVHSKGEMLLPMGLTALSGIAAFVGQMEIVEWGYRGGTPRHIATLARWLTPGFFGAGVGAFLAAVSDTLT
jgi:hypothetical protein